MRFALGFTFIVAILVGCDSSSSSSPTAAAPTLAASGTATSPGVTETPQTAEGSPEPTVVPSVTASAVPATSTATARPSAVPTVEATATVAGTPPPAATSTPISPVATPAITATPPAATATTIVPTAVPTPVATPVPAAVQVTIQGFGYQPQSLEIDRGTVVTWTNQDPVQHDADAQNGSWDGPLLAQGDSWSRTFSTGGTFSITCSIHPFMQALVTVR